MTLARLTAAVHSEGMPPPGAPSQRPRQRSRLADTITALAANQQAALALERQRIEQAVVADREQRDADREDRRADRVSRDAILALLAAILANTAKAPEQPKQ